jgi:putative ATP-binding cassette transporter
MKTLRNIFRLISFLLRNSRSIPRSRITMVLIMVTGIISGLSVTALVMLINYALSNIGSLPSKFTWAFVLLCIVTPLARFASQVLLVRLTAQSIFVLRMQLCRRILSAPLRQLEELGTARLLATLTQDIPSVIAALTALPFLCVDIAVVIGCLVYLGWLSTSLLFGVLGFIVIGIGTYQLLLFKAIRYFHLARDEADTIFDHYRALLNGTKELKLHRRRRNNFNTNLETTSSNLQNYNVSGSTLTSAAASWSEILFFIFIGGLLFVVSRFAYFDVHILTAYIFTTLFMRTPLSQIMNTIPSYGMAKVAVNKIETLGLSLDAQSSEEESTNKPNPQLIWKTLELSGITHAYKHEGEDKDFMLGPIDLVLHSGEIVFLVGGNGSGKTTLAKILTGLYVPDSGEIFLDGKPVTSENRDDYRQEFSVVFSDFYVFETLLGFDEPDTDMKARGYLAKLQLNHKVKVESGVLSTVDLSQGQRKRLALLTAYLEDRPIYLFDEWAADQDPMFKEVFYHNLLPDLKARGKTVFVISHDDRYYHVADRIIKLDYGKLALENYSAPALTSSL